jgi:hypothetical protein
MYCPSDGEYIAEYMRANDVFECRAAGFATPLGAIDGSVKESREAWTFCYGGVPLCVFGYVPDSAGGAIFWLLGTDKIKYHAREFMRQSKLFKARMMEKFEYLTNVVCMDNQESVRWLQWLGAEFMEETAEIMGKAFQRFYIERCD